MEIDNRVLIDTYLHAKFHADLVANFYLYGSISAIQNYGRQVGWLVMSFWIPRVVLLQVLLWYHVHYGVGSERYLTNSQMGHSWYALPGINLSLWENSMKGRFLHKKWGRELRISMPQHKTVNLVNKLNKEFSLLSEQFQ